MDWMIYGANGYTGELAAIDAVRRGLKPVLAGRNEAAVSELANRLGLDYRVFNLDRPEQVSQAISGMHVILHCAGPFSVTSPAHDQSLPYRGRSLPGYNGRNFCFRRGT